MSNDAELPGLTKKHLGVYLTASDLGMSTTKIGSIDVSLEWCVIEYNLREVLCC